MRFSLKFGDAATSWLMVALMSIIFMGFYAFMIVLSRAPGFNLLFTDQKFFFTALVTHVVLSLVIWFVAFILFFSYAVTFNAPYGKIDHLAALCAALGVLTIVATPFTGPASPLLNNYVPTLNRSLYFAGLLIFFGSSAFGAVLRAPALIRKMRDDLSAPALIPGALSVALLALLVGAFMMITARIQLAGALDDGMNPQYYFELLFWGGGHALQFANTLCMVAGWSYLLYRLTGENPMDNRVVYIVLAVMTCFLLLAPIQYLLNPVDSPELRKSFTLIKNWGVSIAPIALGLFAVKRLKHLKDEFHIRRGLLLSMTLYAMGGAIALTISGSDTRVPAHYHGVIGGVTLCYMTLGMLAMVDLGWLSGNSKWLKRQVTLYGVGQGMFVIGLFAGGLLGLARKTYGQAQVLDTLNKIFSMGVMGIGGALAITAGGVFVILMLKGLSKGYRSRYSL